MVSHKQSAVQPQANETIDLNNNDNKNSTGVKAAKWAGLKNDKLGLKINLRKQVSRKQNGKIILLILQMTENCLSKENK